MVGGELTMDSLDLRYEPIAKVYEAPLQLKANGGMFLIDDFGRQQISPQELLNRWIVPLEEWLRLFAPAIGAKFRSTLPTAHRLFNQLRPHAAGRWRIFTTDSNESGSWGAKRKVILPNFCRVL